MNICFVTVSDTQEDNKPTRRSWWCGVDGRGRGVHGSWCHWLLHETELAFLVHEITVSVILQATVTEVSCYLLLREFRW